MVDLSSLVSANRNHLPFVQASAYEGHIFDGYISAGIVLQGVLDGVIGEHAFFFKKTQEKIMRNMSINRQETYKCLRYRCNIFRGNKTEPYCASINNIK